MSDMPTVTVVIPSYNRADMVGRAILSVMGQINKDWECIVVDDGSKDNTKEVVEGFIRKDSRISYLFKENGGQGSARNLGIRHARGEWILPLDSDDALLPEALETLVREAERAKADFISGRTWRVVWETGRIKGIGGSTPSSMLLRKKLFTDYGLYDESRNISEDVDYWYRLQRAAKRGEISLSQISYPTSIYFSHTDQVTSLKNPAGLINIAQGIINRWSPIMLSDREGRLNMSRWWRNLGTYETLAGNRVAGLRALKRAFKIHHSLEIIILYILALIGTGVFRNTAPRLRGLYEESVSKIYFIQYAVSCPKEMRISIRQIHQICRLTENL